MSTEQLQTEIEAIKIRSQRVEINKAWEVSWTRKILILILTYFVAVLFFWVNNLSRPFINSLVPVFGFFLSTLTIPWVKNIWVRKNNAA